MKFREFVNQAMNAINNDTKNMINQITNPASADTPDISQLRSQIQQVGNSINKMQDPNIKKKAMDLYKIFNNGFNQIKPPQVATNNNQLATEDFKTWVQNVEKPIMAGKQPSPMPKKFDKNQLVGMMKQGLTNIQNILDHGEMRLRNTFKAMATRHNFSTSEKGYPGKPVAGAVSTGPNQMTAVGGGKSVSINTNRYQNPRGVANTARYKAPADLYSQQYAHHIPEGEFLFEIADIFDALDVEGSKELADVAYLAYDMLIKEEASPITSPQADDLKRLFQGIYMAVVTEFKKILAELQKAGLI